MHRTFETSTARRQRTLDGQWEFATDPDDRGRDEEWYDGFPAEADRITVPAAWNVHSEYYDHEGVAWYRRRFDQPVDTAAKLTFHGVCHDASVWLDGEHLADHYGGYTPFSEVVDLAAGEHEIVVRADSSRDERAIPKPGTDWYPYGGITREVLVEEVPDVFVDGLEVTYALDGDRATLDAAVDVRNLADDTDESVGLAVEPAPTRRRRSRRARRPSTCRSRSTWTGGRARIRPCTRSSSRSARTSTASGSASARSR